MKPTRLLAFTLAALLSVTNFAAPAPVPAEPKEDAKTELAKLAGTWKVVSYTEAGADRFDGEEVPEVLITFKKDGSFEWVKGFAGSGKIARIDPSKKPKEVDYTFDSETLEGKTQKAIYKLDGDTFSDCFGEPGTDRPTEFKSTKENGWSVIVYKRVKRKD